jgi:hypothetical protein
MKGVKGTAAPNRQCSCGKEIGPISTRCQSCNMKHRFRDPAAKGKMKSAQLEGMRRRTANRSIDS